MLRLIFFMLLLPAFKPAESQSLSFGNIQKKYFLQRSFVFNLVNTSDTTLFYIVSLEMQEKNGKWQEVRIDVFTYRITRSARLWDIRAKTTKKNVFLPGKYMRPSENYFRLRIPYGHDYRVNKGVIYSDKFTFTK